MKSTISRVGGSQNSLTDEAFKMNVRSAPGAAKTTNV